MEQNEIDDLKEANLFMINERQFFLIPLIAKLLEDKEIEINFQELKNYGETVEIEVEGIDENRAKIRKLERDIKDENNN